MFKDLNFTLALPLFGVGVGWLLSEVGFLLRSRRDRKKVLGRVILRLLELRQLIENELRRVTLAQELLRLNRLSTENRQQLAEMKDNRIDECLADSAELIGEISTVDPFLAFKLEQRLRPVADLIKLAGGYVKEWNDSPEEIQRFWDKTFIFAARIAFEDLSKELRTSILKLASKKSMLSLMRGWWHFRDEANRQGNIRPRNLRKLWLTWMLPMTNLLHTNDGKSPDLNPNL